jgi:tetratricopeptide (TPR) repeat protein
MRSSPHRTARCGAGEKWYCQRMAPSARAVRWCVTWLCIAGAVRVFLGCAALPLFNDVDEQAHYDLVRKYARGYWPTRQHETWDRETAELQVLYGSLEFRQRPEAHPGGVYPPPVWTWPGSPERDDYVNRRSAAMARFSNQEAHSPPLYYLAGAAWSRLGGFAGLRGPAAAYWVRFLNVPLFALLVAAAHLFCRAYFSPFVALAVPALTAFFPSTLFFGVTCDALSPLLALLSLWLLLQWQASARPAARLSVLAGGAAAAAFLVKLTNAVLPAAAGLLVARRWRASTVAGTLRRDWRPGAALLLALGLPVAAWMLLNAATSGDLTGTAAKVAELGWRPKPLAALLDHPLFTIAGQQLFWGRLLANFYEGDMNWLGRPATRSAPARVLFVASFALLPLALGLAWRRRRAPGATRLTLAGGLCAFALGGMVAQLIGLSLRWDFGTGVYPSRGYPYLSSGRLISGAIVPFLALYAWSLEVVFGRTRWLPPAIVALSVALMAAPQASLLVKAGGSRYNFFHLGVPASAAEASTGRGLLAVSAGRLGEAAARFSEAAAADPADLAALANLGLTLAALQDDAGALRAFTRALQVRPDSAMLHNSRGAVFAAAGDWSAASIDHGAAVRLAPQTPFYRFPLAHALAKTGRAADAAEHYAAILRQTADWPRVTFRASPKSHAHPDPAVQSRLAARAVQRAEQADRGDGIGLLGGLDELAAAYADAQRFEEAAAALELAIGVAERDGAPAAAARFRELLERCRGGARRP